LEEGARGLKGRKEGEIEMLTKKGGKDQSLSLLCGNSGIEMNEPGGHRESLLPRYK